MKKIMVRIRAMKGLGILLLGLIAGCMLLFLGGMDERESVAAASEELFSFKTYEQDLAARLEGMIDRLEGVSDAHVMLTIDRSYSQELAGNSGEYLTVREADGGQGTVTVSSKAPVVKGVAVICKGGNLPEKQIEIIEMLAALLNLPTHKIFVSEG